MVTNISSTLHNGQFATIVHDVKNVTLFAILELAMAPSCYGFRCDLFSSFYVHAPLLSWPYRLAFYLWFHPRLRRFRSHFPFQCRSCSFQGQFRIFGNSNTKWLIILSGLWLHLLWSLRLALTYAYLLLQPNQACCGCLQSCRTVRRESLPSCSRSYFLSSHSHRHVGCLPGLHDLLALGHFL